MIEDKIDNLIAALDRNTAAILGNATTTTAAAVAAADSQPEQEELTPAQKAARTRAANRAKAKAEAEAEAKAKQPEPDPAQQPAPPVQAAPQPATGPVMGQQPQAQPQPQAGPVMGAPETAPTPAGAPGLDYPQIHAYATAVSRKLGPRNGEIQQLMGRFMDAAGAPVTRLPGLQDKDYPQFWAGLQQLEASIQ